MRCVVRGKSFWNAEKHFQGRLVLLLLKHFHRSWDAEKRSQICLFANLFRALVAVIAHQKCLRLLGVMRRPHTMVASMAQANRTYTRLGRWSNGNTGLRCTGASAT